jgi:hypothetical protein
MGDMKTSPATKRSCFREPGTHGSPRLILFNKKRIGFGAKFSALAEYVSSWDKEGKRSDGLRGVFSIGISGLNLSGGRWGRWIGLVGLTGGIGIGTLKVDDDSGQQRQITEYTPRAGVELHLVSLGRDRITLMLKGGYIFSMMKRTGEDEYTTQHGGYAGVGIEFIVSDMVKYFTPAINVAYGGYGKGRHELMASAGLRF